MFLALILSSQVALSPQQRAIATVDSAVAVMGGLPKLRAIKRLQRELVGTRPDISQGPAPHVPDDAPVREILARDGTNRIANALDLVVRGGLRLHLRSATDGVKNFQINYENNTRTDFPDARSIPFLQSVLRRFPEVLLMNAQRRPEALRWAGSQKVDNRMYDVVSYGDVDGEVNELYFDATTHELSRVSRLSDDAIRGDSRVTTIYTKYEDEQGFHFPKRVLILQGNDTTSDVRVEKVALDSAVVDSLFAAPEGLPTVTPANPNPSLVPLGSDVYLVKGSYNSGFVVFDEYVLVLEAPISAGFQEAVINLIKSVAKDKPIRYVVSTHFHYDHLGGLRPFIARGATIVTTSAAGEVIRDLAKAPHTIRPDALARAPVAPKVELVTDTRTFSDAHHRVDVVLLQDMPHVPQILVAYLPAIKTLFQGDLYDSYALQDVPLTKDGVKMLTWLESAGLDVEQIIPVHGPVAPVPLATVRQARVLRSTQ